MNLKKAYMAFATISLLFLFLISVCALSLILFFKGSSDTAKPEPEYIYVYEDNRDTESAEAVPKKWILREHEGRIGIFNEKNVLIQVIETYVKTLPLSDRSLLREGIEVYSEEALYSLIEDYTD